VPVLMENAALGVVDALAERFPEAERVGVLCGPGNNGADGLAVARQLLTRGYASSCERRFRRPPQPDFDLQLGMLRAARKRRRPSSRRRAREAGLAAFADCDVLVDALFGVGLTRPLEGAWARLVEALAGRRSVVAVDLPSGLDADRRRRSALRCARSHRDLRGAQAGARARPACDLCGEVVVADLGVPFEPEAGAGTLHRLIRRGARPGPAAPARRRAQGRLRAPPPGRRVAGKAGAMVLAARAAVIGGAGLTTVALPESLAAALAAGCPEAMSLPLPGGETGTLGARGSTAARGGRERRETCWRSGRVSGATRRPTS
jgi:ADP-dependent NAD(P)H-hydrate dehydratase / NAD(P)H-hydrate epimerase